MKRILLVEDERKIREGLAAMIERMQCGFRVAGQAANGVEALEWWTANEADVVLTDIRMDRMGGLQLIARLRETRPKLPFVVLSGYGEFEYAREALRHGVVDYLLKPIQSAELSQVLHRLGAELDGERGDAGRPAAEEEEKERRTIRLAKELILQSLDREISLQSLADRLYLHPKYLSGLFKKETGQNLSDFVTNARLEKAKRLLAETHIKVADVAALCGFTNTKYFMTVFKTKIGVTPSEYRDFPD